MQTANLLFSSGAAIYEKCKSTESGIYERFGSCLLAEPAQRRVSVMVPAVKQEQEERMGAWHIRKQI